jgi:hypothetical protein
MTKWIVEEWTSTPRCWIATREGVEGDDATVLTDEEVAALEAADLSDVIDAGVGAGPLAMHESKRLVQRAVAVLNLNATEQTGVKKHTRKLSGGGTTTVRGHARTKATSGDRAKPIKCEVKAFVFETLLHHNHATDEIWIEDDKAEFEATIAAFGHRPLIVQSDESLDSAVFAVPLLTTEQIAIAQKLVAQVGGKIMTVAAEHDHIWKGQWRAKGGYIRDDIEAIFGDGAQEREAA